MADPAQIDIIADRRVAYFNDWSFLDVNWAGSSFEMEVRLVRDTVDTPLLEATSGGGSLSLLYTGTATVTAHIAAGRLTPEVYSLINPATGVNYASGDSVTLSQLHMQLASIGFLAAFPFASERGDDLQAYYDIIRTPATGDAELIMRGKFTLRAGVTIP